MDSETIRGNLRREYRDTITGAVGVATAWAVYATGSDRVCLEWATVSGQIEMLWVDAERLVKL